MNHDRARHLTNERERLEALHALRILDTPPEARFDRITSLATRVLRVPKADISMVDGDREWLELLLRTKNVCDITVWIVERPSEDVRRSFGGRQPFQ